MKRAAVLGLIAAAGLAVAWFVVTRPGDLVLEKLHDGLFVISGNGGNTAAFVHAAGVVLVDTKVSGNGQAILDVLKTVTDKPVTHLLNTHTHHDHVGSNAFFAEPVEIVAHAQTARLMATMPHFDAADERRGLPDRTFRDRMTILSGDDAIDLYHFGPAHTSGDAFIVFRARRVMHAGDVFLEGGPHVDPDNGGSAEAFAATLEKAVAGISGVDSVIPGHGGVKTWRAFVDHAAQVRSSTSDR